MPAQINNCSQFPFIKRIKCRMSRRRDRFRRGQSGPRKILELLKTIGPTHNADIHTETQCSGLGRVEDIFLFAYSQGRTVGRRVVRFN